MFEKYFICKSTLTEFKDKNWPNWYEFLIKICFKLWLYYIFLMLQVVLQFKFSEKIFKKYVIRMWKI